MVQAGTSPQLRIEVGARSYENDLDSYNVLAEIPGTDATLRGLSSSARIWIHGIRRPAPRITRTAQPP